MTSTRSSSDSRSAPSTALLSRTSTTTFRTRSICLGEQALSTTLSLWCFASFVDAFVMMLASTSESSVASLMTTAVVLVLLLQVLD